LERKPADKEIGRLLIATNLTKSHSAGTVAMGLLDTADGGADLRAACVASCLRGAFSPVDLHAVCLVRAMVLVDVE